MSARMPVYLVKGSDPVLLGVAAGWMLWNPRNEYTADALPTP